MDIHNRITKLPYTLIGRVVLSLRKKPFLMFIVLFVVIVGVIITCMVFSSNRTNFIVPITYSDGFKARLPIPKGSSNLGRAGLGVNEFKTSKSVEEVEQFYSEYFNRLQKVKDIHDETNIAYYDSGQRLVVNFEIIPKGTKTHFLLTYETYNEDSWTIDE